MLTAFLSGASQGLNVLGQGMLKDVERDNEQGIWEKRQALLSQIQRENAKAIREDEFKFRNDPTNVQTEIGTATTKSEAAGKVSRAEKVRDLTEPELKAAREAEEARKLADELGLFTDKNKVTVDGKIRVVQASGAEARRTAAAGREAANKNPLTAKFADYEEATGTKLPPEVKKQIGDAYLGLGKVDDAVGKKALDAVLKGYSDGTVKSDQVGAELGALMKSLKGDTERMAPPPGAVEMLLKNPSLAAAFDAKNYSVKASDVLAGRGKPAAKNAAAAGSSVSLIDMSALPLEQLPTTALENYSKTHPDYAKAQAEIRRRELSRYGAGSESTRQRFGGQ